jgi:hypothetical protein
MPVIRADSLRDPTTSVRETITSRLVEELLGSGGLADPPLIFEVPSADPGEVDVTVVWNAWKVVPADQRPEIIAEAYRRFAAVVDENTTPSRPGQSKQITLPRASRSIGVTEEESRRIGALPFGLRAIPGVLDADRLTLLRSAFRDLGAPRGGRSLELVVPTAEMRDAALTKLRQAFPDLEFETFELNPSEVDT